MRGIAPTTLLSQVKNTAPFFYEAPAEWLARAPHLGPLLAELPGDGELGELDYFRLCLSAHHGTVATFVPTDVDNQIRHRLWCGIAPETLRAMVELVLESRSWDCRPLTARFVVSPETGDVVSGHNGEWFSTAVGAYGATRGRAPQLAALVSEEIRREVALEAGVFEALARAGDGLAILRACTLIAHNLGDLSRVIEMWGLERDPATDFGRASHPTLALACELNKAKMAPENHRHLQLRKPRALRRSADLFLPLGPFFDDWGALLARHPALNDGDLGEVAEALVIGMERTPGSIGYARALAGLESRFRGGAAGLQKVVPARTARELKAGPLRTLIAVPQARFEQQWATFAVQFIRSGSSRVP